MQAKPSTLHPASSSGTPGAGWLKGKGAASPLPGKRGTASPGAKKAGLAAFKKGSGFGKKKKDQSEAGSPEAGAREIKTRLFFQQRQELTDEQVRRLALTLLGGERDRERGDREGARPGTRRDSQCRRHDEEADEGQGAGGCREMLAVAQEQMPPPPASGAPPTSLMYVGALKVCHFNNGYMDPSVKGPTGWQASYRQGGRL